MRSESTYKCGIYVNLASKEKGISKKLNSLFDYMINNQIGEDDEFLCDIEIDNVIRPPLIQRKAFSYIIWLLSKFNRH